MDAIWPPLAIALAALPPAAGRPAEPVVSERAAFGAFEFTGTAIPRAMLTVHAARDGTRMALSIREGEHVLALTDNGAVVAITVSSAGCGGAMRPLRYQGRIGEPRLFDSMRRFTTDLPEACLPGAGKRVLLGRLRAARGDFVRGVQHMKARADALFGGWRNRCPPPPVQRTRSGVIFIQPPSPHDPCLGS